MKHIFLYILLFDSLAGTSLCLHALPLCPTLCRGNLWAGHVVVHRGGWEEMMIQAERQASAKSQRYDGEALGRKHWNRKTGMVFLGTALCCTSTKAWSSRAALLAPAPPHHQQYEYSASPFPIKYQAPACQLCHWGLARETNPPAQGAGLTSPCSPTPASSIPRGVPSLRQE